MRAAHRTRNYRPRKWVVACVVAAMSALSASGAFLATRSGSASAQSTGVSANISALVLIDQFVRQAGVQDLRTLASAGSGKAAMAIIGGTGPGGAPCWMLVAAGGHQGSPFRCGSAPAPASGPLWVFDGIGGAADSTTADYASLVGLVTSSVTRVEAELVDGSTKDLALTSGAFAYASSSPNDLPRSIRAFDASGRLLAEKDIILTSGSG